MGAGNEFDVVLTVDSVDCDGNEVGRTVDAARGEPAVANIAAAFAALELIAAARSRTFCGPQPFSVRKRSCFSQYT